MGPGLDHPPCATGRSEPGNDAPNRPSSGHRSRHGRMEISSRIFGTFSPSTYLFAWRLAWQSDWRRRHQKRRAPSHGQSAKAPPVLIRLLSEFLTSQPAGISPQLSKLFTRLTMMVNPQPAKLLKKRTITNLARVLHAPTGESGLFGNPGQDSEVSPGSNPTDTETGER